MDAFFASVEERQRPDLRGLPIVVGADPKAGKGRGVVSTANYRARELGIRSAMPISRAWRLAERARLRGEPATVFLRGHYELYRAVSGRIMEILERGADAIEEASIDEAYLDVSSLGSLEGAEQRAVALKAEILAREGLTCSIGIGPNKLIAKIASGIKKPDGLMVVSPEMVQSFLDPLSIREIPGIGPKTAAFLQAQQIRTVRELRHVPGTQLIQWFGRRGERFLDNARGIDASPVSGRWIPKSVGRQETFELDTRDAGFLTNRLSVMAEHAIARLREEGFQAFRTLTLTVRFADFETTSRSRTLERELALAEGGAAVERLKQEALALLLPFLDTRENPEAKAIRLLGLRLEKLSRP
jgi:DNA polymerase IV (DinB-like DNA polymerase)